MVVAAVNNGDSFKISQLDTAIGKFGICDDLAGVGKATVVIGME